MTELEIFKKCLKDEAEALLNTIDNFGEEVLEAIKIIQAKYNINYQVCSTQIFSKYLLCASNYSEP